MSTIENSVGLAPNAGQGGERSNGWTPMWIPHWLTLIVPVLSLTHMSNMQENDRGVIQACRALIATLLGMTPREREVLLADPTIRAQLLRLEHLLSEVVKEF
jgi:hypothetical protein